MTQGRSETSLLVITDRTLKAVTTAPQDFAPHLLGKTEQQPALVPSTSGTGVNPPPRPLLAGDTTGKKNSLL